MKEDITVHSFIMLWGGQPCDILFQGKYIWPFLDPDKISPNSSLENNFAQRKRIHQDIIEGITLNSLISIVESRGVSS